MMKQFICTIFLTTALIHAAAGSDHAIVSVDGPIKPGIPTSFVSTTLQKILSKEHKIATELNGGNVPKGDISVPYQAIARIGYPAYVEENPEMIDDSIPLISSINNDPYVQSAWDIVVATKGTPLPVRKDALLVYWVRTNETLTHEETKLIPDLKGAPVAVDIMLTNQTLVLNREQKKVWNAIFAVTASILNTMDDEDHDVFVSLFRKDLPISVLMRTRSKSL